MILESVTTGAVQDGQRIVISGVEKIGKTTLSCNAPRPLLVPLEIGYSGMSVPKTPLLTSMPQVFQLLQEIIGQAQRGTFPYKSIVWDTATALEKLIHDEVVRGDPNYNKGNTRNITMESAHGGYGKAYQRSNEVFNDFLSMLDQLAMYGKINQIITCHVFAARVVDPTSGEFDTWDLLLHSPKNQKNYGKREIITQWADMIGFLYEPVHVIASADGKPQQLSRAVSTNRGRVLGLDRTPGYVAGNRYGLTGEIPIPPQGGWNYLADAVYKSRGIDIWNYDQQEA